MSRHSAIDQNHDDDNVLADTQFVGVRSCRLDFCAFPALRCTLSMALSESQQQQPQSVAPPIAVTFLLFVNGQLIVTGVRSVEHINAAVAEHRDDGQQKHLQADSRNPPPPSPIKCDHTFT
ncbi:hypothetical protein niasHT_019951 [Heterodera trifolii]|uniref:Uncharacterized protein n=1 Tax=Heterodera trifolii TaxID=157864 RepID=A0ABD2LHR1_9BILA